MTDTRARAVPVLDDVRIRLEGSLEQIERALSRCEKVERLLGSHWRAGAHGQLELLGALGDSDEVDRLAAARMDELSRREGWSDGFEAQRTLTRYRRARAALHARLDALFPNTKGTASLAPKLAALAAEAIPGEAGAPVVSCEVAYGRGVTWLASGVLAVAATALVALFARSVPLLPAAIAGALAGFFGAAWATSGRLELFTDRVRLQGRFGTREAALRAHPVTARAAQAQVAGWSAVRLGMATEARHFAEVAALLTVGLGEADGPPSPVMALEAATNGPGATETGALVLLRDGAWFLRNGQATFDAAVARPQRVFGTSARALGAALGALSLPQQRSWMARLTQAGRADAIAPFELERAAVEGDLLRATRFRASLPRGFAARIEIWQRLLAGRG